jgi:hypothetical protein
MWLSRASAVALSLFLSAICAAQGPSSARDEARSRQNEAVYAPYAFLIGEWDTAVPGAPPAFQQSFSWRAQGTYVWFAVHLSGNGGGQRLHQEGMMTWNAASKNLDFLFVHEPGSRGQERGVVRVEADGTVVRETTLTDGDGALGYFRQTWRKTGPATAVTSLLRRNADGTWTANFPGSDKLVMTRRPS